MTRRLSLLLLALLFGACSGDGGEVQDVSSPVGPPAIQDDVVAEHAAQFDDDLPRRAAGSQQEFAAASYITGHLQQAGYIVALDGVPVEDLVRSTNVVAQPPSGDDPQIVVTVPYDTPRPGRPPGSMIGAFLELARALRVAVPNHSVEFVALGAEHSRAEGGALGSRRLIRVLQEAEVTPEVLQIVDARAPSGGFKAYGPAADALHRIAFSGPTAISTEALFRDPDPFMTADFSSTLVVGFDARGAQFVLDYLEERAQ